MIISNRKMLIREKKHWLAVSPLGNKTPELCTCTYFCVQINFLLPRKARNLFIQVPDELIDRLSAFIPGEAIYRVAGLRWKLWRSMKFHQHLKWKVRN